MISAFQSNAFQKSPLAFQIATTVTVVSDTHDDVKRRNRKFREDREQLHKMLDRAFRLEYGLPLEEEIADTVEPFIEQESVQKEVRIDWESLQKDIVADLKLQRLIAAYRLEIEEIDDEEATFFL